MGRHITLRRCGPHHLGESGIWGCTVMAKLNAVKTIQNRCLCTRTCDTRQLRRGFMSRTSGNRLVLIPEQRHAQNPSDQEEMSELDLTAYYVIVRVFVMILSKKLHIMPVHLRCWPVVSPRDCRWGWRAA